MKRWRVWIAMLALCLIALAGMMLHTSRPDEVETLLLQYGPVKSYYIDVAEMTRGISTADDFVRMTVHLRRSA
jgi:hypothetical protein